jgi:hypothetical protein
VWNSAPDDQQSVFRDDQLVRTADPGAGVDAMLGADAVA